MKGIPMTAQDVRALLTCAKCGKISVSFPCEHCGSEDFLKTQTRRVIKPQPLNLTHYPTPPAENIESGFWGETIDGESRKWNPPYRPGDVVYVKEGYQITDYHESDLVGTFVSGYYDANGSAFEKIALTVEESKKWGARQYPFRATPGRFMYRSLARIFEEITDVRVERVQEISEEDARAEGVIRDEDYPVDPPDFSICPSCAGQGVHGALGSELGYMEVDCTTCETHKQRFHHLWDSINKTHTWESNPYVFVYGLKRRAG